MSLFPGRTQVSRRSRPSAIPTGRSARSAQATSVEGQAWSGSWRGHQPDDWAKFLRRPGSAGILPAGDIAGLRPAAGRMPALPGRAPHASSVRCQLPLAYQRTGQSEIRIRTSRLRKLPSNLPPDRRFGLPPPHTRHRAAQGMAAVSPRVRDDAARRVRSRPEHIHRPRGGHDPGGRLRMRPLACHICRFAILRPRRPIRTTAGAVPGPARNDATSPREGRDWSERHGRARTRRSSRPCRSPPGARRRHRRQTAVRDRGEPVRRTRRVDQHHAPHPPVGGSRGHPPRAQPLGGGDRGHRARRGRPRDRGELVSGRTRRVLQVHGGHAPRARRLRHPRVRRWRRGDHPRGGAGAAHARRHPHLLSRGRSRHGPARHDRRHDCALRRER